MTWGELKQAAEKIGLKDEETVEFFDREMFNEPVQLYRALGCASPRKKGEMLDDAVDWVDALRDRYTLPNADACWHEGIGFPYSHGDGRVVAVRDDDPEEGTGGIVKVFFSSVLPFERAGAVLKRSAVSQP